MGAEPRRRKRIHPGVAITAIVGIVALACVSQLVGSGLGETFKILAATIIAYLVGIKTRPKLPLT